MPRPGKYDQITVPISTGERRQRVTKGEAVRIAIVEAIDRRQQKGGHRDGK